MVATQNVTEYPPPVIVSFRFPIASAPVPVELAAAQAPLHPPAVAVAPTSVALDTADVGVTKPEVVERPQLPTQDARISDNSEDSMPIENSQTVCRVLESPLDIDPVDQRLAAEARPTYRQLSRHLLRQNLHPINYCETRFNVLSDRELLLKLVAFNQHLVVRMDSTEFKQKNAMQFFESLERSRAKLRQSFTEYRCLSTSNSSPNPFSHTLQSQKPPEFLEKQKETKSRSTLKKLKKRLSFSNDVNTIIETGNQTKFCFSQSNIVTATTCLAHCVSSDFAISKNLASAIAFIKN